MKLNFELRPTNGTCLCELINSGMCDGAKKQVICPAHPNNRSTPEETPFRIAVWTVRNVFTRAGEHMRRLMRELHIVHTWSPWTQSGPAYPVAYPWTRAGCYAHFSADETRHCMVCDLPQKRWAIL